MAFLSVGMVQVHAEAKARSERVRERGERERQAPEERWRKEIEAGREAREVELWEQGFAQIGIAAKI